MWINRYGGITDMSTISNAEKEVYSSSRACCERVLSQPSDDLHIASHNISKYIYDDVNNY